MQNIYFAKNDQALPFLPQMTTLRDIRTLHTPPVYERLLSTSPNHTGSIILSGRHSEVFVERNWRAAFVGKCAYRRVHGRPSSIPYSSDLTGSTATPHTLCYAPSFQDVIFNLKLPKESSNIRNVPKCTTGKDQHGYIPGESVCTPTGKKTGSTKLKNTFRYFPRTTQNEKNTVTEALKYLDTRILPYCVYTYQMYVKATVVVPPLATPCNQDRRLFLRPSQDIHFSRTTTRYYCRPRLKSIVVTSTGGGDTTADGLDPTISSLL